MADGATQTFANLGYRIRGIVHIGAHDGEEVEDYLNSGYLPIFLFEPNPDGYTRLTERYSQSGIYVFGVGLGAKDEERELIIPRHLHDSTDDSQSASYFYPDYKSPYSWGERGKKFRTIKSSVKSFTSWRRGLDPGTNGALNECNALVVDVQGMELDVLKGIGLFDLMQFHFLSIECSKVPIYKGEASAFEVISYLSNYGYAPLPETPVKDHDDILFVHRSAK